jgi:hypothetical protein
VIACFVRRIWLSWGLLGLALLFYESFDIIKHIPSINLKLVSKLHIAYKFSNA